MSTVVPVRISKELAEKINELVKTGLYSSRSNLIREALRRFIASEQTLTPRTSVGEFAAKLASTIIMWNEKAVTDVILFGSAARGEATAESDVDLLILTEEAQPWRVRQRLYGLIYPIIPLLGVDVSLIVINKNIFASMVREGDPFAISVINEGIKLRGELLNEYGKSPHRKSV